MKKGIIFFIIIFAVIFAVPTFAQNYNATFNGVYGYILTPTAITCPAMNFIIGTTFIFNTASMPISIVFSPLKDWEIGFAYELSFQEGVTNPFQLSTKVQFVKGASFGIIIDSFFGGEGLTTIEPYIALHSGSIFGKGVMDVTIGKGFYIGQGQDDLLNLYIGTKIPLIGDQFVLLAEFLNNPHRIGGIGYYDVGRGAFNLGFLLNISDFLTIHFITFDILDGFDFVMALGINLKLGL